MIGTALFVICVLAAGCILFNKDDWNGKVNLPRTAGPRVRGPFTYNKII